MNTFTFDSKILSAHEQLHTFSQTNVKKEPMLFFCDFTHAYNLGGRITKNFLETLPDHWVDDPTFIFDSRVHMLMPNFYPCIPGWHHDDVPRERSDGQPEYYNPSYRANHCMALINGDVAPTEFAIGRAEFEDVPLGEKYYKVWHDKVNKKIREGELTTISAPSNTIIYFDCNTWHRGTKAVKFGWRWFGRASINTNRPFQNEVRNQVQVYLDKEDESW